MPEQRRLRILVIDDEVTQRMLVKEYLEEAGHVVRQADDGKRGLKMATTTGPDLILLDVMLPSIDGFDLCRSLKEHPNTAHTPVILITASREGDVIARGLAAGADDFVTKPVDWNFLADRVEHVARKSHERAQLLQMIEERPEAGEAAPSRESHAPTLPGIEELMRSAELQAEQAASGYANELANLKAEYDEELAHARAENERLVVVARTAVQQAQEAAERSHAAEIAKLRVMVESAHALAAEREEEHRAVLSLRAREIQVLRETFDAERMRFDTEMESLNGQLATLSEQLVARPAPGAGDVPWTIAMRSLAWQSGLASALTARTQAALSSPGRLDAARLNDLDRTAQTLATAIQNFKRFAHTMATANECKAGPVNVATLVTQIAAQAKGIAANARVDLRTRITAPNEVVEADEARLRYAWICLVVNAIRFTPPGGHVVLEAVSDDQGGIRFQVSDSGVGMAAARVDALNAILDEPGTTPVKPGEAAGLGVPMAAALARQMGGDLVIRSQPGRGTKAALVFPREKRVAVPGQEAVAS